MSDNDTEFKEWMQQVDRLLSRSIGLSSGDMRDRLWRDAFENGDSPAVAIEDLVGSLDDVEGIMENELFG